jgi:hypothetical protein
MFRVDPAVERYLAVLLGPVATRRVEASSDLARHGGTRERGAHVRTP